jgi:hypothetical protein
MEALGVDELDSACVTVELNGIVMLWGAELLGV